MGWRISLKLDSIKFEIHLEELLGVQCPSACKNLEPKEQEFHWWYYCENYKHIYCIRNFRKSLIIQGRLRRKWILNLGLGDFRYGKGSKNRGSKRVRDCSQKRKYQSLKLQPCYCSTWCKVRRVSMGMNC